MRFLFSLMEHLLALAGLLLFAALARGHAGAVFDPIFELAGGDTDVLVTLLCVSLVLIVTSTWIWSARTHRPPA